MKDYSILLDKFKHSLRISHAELDDDIIGNIDACLADLRRVGVNTYYDANNLPALQTKAIDLYLKWQYDYAGKGQQYEICYNNLRDAMSMCGDYQDV